MNSLYQVHGARTMPDLGGWESPSWQAAETLQVAYSYPQSGDFLPSVAVRLLWNQEGIYGIYRVEDRYVLAEKLDDQGQVCKDSCVEFFVRPADNNSRPAEGYFNFEFNCIGTLHCAYRAAQRDADNKPIFSRFINAEELAAVRRVPSLPHAARREDPQPLTWTLGFFIPFAVLGHYTDLPDFSAGKGSSWTCGFFHCADNSSHQRWLSWQPHPQLNYHLAECFGELRFLPEA